MDIQGEVATSARKIDKDSATAQREIPSLLVSADSHASEPDFVWKELTNDLRSRLPLFIGKNKRRQGAYDPKLRVVDQQDDGVAAEILYPDHALSTFAADQDVQEAAFPLYNDWLADYCKTSPKRLFGIPCIPVYDIDKGIKELHRANDMGLIGALVWQVPPKGLPFTSPHYDKLFSALEELGAPLSVHILTGFNYSADLKRVSKGYERLRFGVNHKTSDAVNCLFDFIMSGVFERHPKLKLGVIESEIGWIRFFLQQWDYYYHRSGKEEGTYSDFPISRQPSDIFKDHVFATFMDDVAGSKQLDDWGENNCMWSNDYPHPNMTWPESKAYLARQIGHLPMEKQKRLAAQNAIDLYKLKI